MAASGKSKLPGRLGELPVVRYTADIPRSRAASVRSDTIFEVKSLEDLAKKLAKRATPAPKK
jgi:hypothetical protein